MFTMEAAGISKESFRFPKFPVNWVVMLDPSLFIQMSQISSFG